MTSEQQGGISGHAEGASPGGRVDSSASGVVFVPLLGMVLVIGVVLFGGRSLAPDIRETTDAVTVSAWGYEQTFPYAAIDSVTLRTTLDGLRARIDAQQSGNVYAGWFDMQPYGKALLFIDVLRKPYVVMHARAGVTLVSASDSTAAQALAIRLRARATQIRVGASTAATMR